MAVPDLLSDHDTVRKRQEAARVAADERINRVLATLRSLRSDVLSGSDTGNGAITIGNGNSNTNGNVNAYGNANTVVVKMEAIEKEMRGLAKALSSGQKAVGGSLIKLGKSIDSSTSTDLSNLCAPSVLLSSKSLNEAICAHLFRDGLYTLGELFAKESCVDISKDQMKPYKKLHEILVSFRSGDLRPAIAWIQRENDIHDNEFNNNDTNTDNDTDTEPDKNGNSTKYTKYNQLEVRLHRLEYLKLLQENRREDALQYARKELGRFPEYLEELGKLMTCLIYSSNLQESPYASLCSRSVWNDLERTLIREYCAGKESNLVTIVRCGAKAIPSLLKASRVAPNWKDLVNLGNLGRDDVLPVEVAVGKSCQFHSIFTCPVYREETTDGSNVPMLLPCGHVLSKHCISRLPKGQQRFKCPYCPREQMEKDCQEVHF